ncbi:MAG: hypothetical protein J6J35_03990 [Alphaproteobacteria bacterium]|nr:hypothetical protein [Alphaproteobacteria bacterium]
MIKKTSLNRIAYFCFLFILLCAQLAWADDEDSPKCLPLWNYWFDGVEDNFVLQRPFKVIKETCARVADFSWNTFATPLQAVVGVGTAIYIAVYTLRNVGSFSQQDTMAYLSGDKGGVIPLGIKLAIITALLGNRDFLYEYIISPVVIGGLDISSLICSQSLFTPSSFAISDVRSLFDSVIKQAQKFNDQIFMIIAIGRILLCLAFLPGIIIDWFWWFIPFGAAFYVFGWLLLIGISFYLMDILLRLGVGCMMLPFAVACGISKLTIDYTKKVWNLFVNVAFNFIILGVVIEFTIQMIDYSVKAGTTVSAGMSLKALLRFDEKITLTESDADLINDALGAEAFIIASICCMIAFKIFCGVGGLVDKISSTSSVGGEAQKLGAEAYNHTVKPVKDKTKSWAKEGLKAGAQEAGDSIAHSRPARAAARFKDNIKDKAKNLVGLDDKNDRDIWGEKIQQAGQQAGQAVDNIVRDALDM